MIESMEPVLGPGICAESGAGEGAMVELCEGGGGEEERTEEFLDDDGDGAEALIPAAAAAASANPKKQHEEEEEKWIDRRRRRWRWAREIRVSRGEVEWHEEELLLGLS